MVTPLGPAHAASHRAPHRTLPAEFEPVAEMLVAWDRSDELEPFFIQLVSWASWSASVVVLLDAETTVDDVIEVLEPAGARMDQVRLVAADSDSVWVRDYGPLVLRDRDTRYVVDFSYFGGANDDQLPAALADALWTLPSSELDLHFEGGNLLSDGTGRCLTSDALITDNAARYSERQIRRLFREELGCRKLIILPRLAGEPTAHVDMYVTLTGPGRAIVGRYDRHDDPENAQRANRAARTLEREGFVVQRIPMPSHNDGLFRTYTNSVAVNDIVLVPVYPEDTAHESAALSAFEHAYPHRRIIPIDSSQIIQLSGAVHCATMTIAR